MIHLSVWYFKSEKKTSLKSANRLEQTMELIIVIFVVYSPICSISSHMYHVALTEIFSQVSQQQHLLSSHSMTSSYFGLGKQTNNWISPFLGVHMTWLLSFHVNKRFTNSFLSTIFHVTRDRQIIFHVENFTYLFFLIDFCLFF